MENTLEKLIEYFEQQLRLQRESKIKYNGEEAYLDSVDVCKNTLNALHQPTVIRSVCCNEELVGFKTYGYDECIGCGSTYRHKK